jgi:methyl-accepting chemotaxis protein
MRKLNLRIGTKLAATAGFGVLLVMGIIVNQQLSNTSVAHQDDVASSEQFTAADILHAGIGLQRMQLETREIRLSISGREADEALARLQASVEEATKHLNAAGGRTTQTENRQRLNRIATLAKDYVAAATALAAAQKDYQDIAPHLQAAGKISAEVDQLIEKATASAVTVASEQKAAAAAKTVEANRIGMAIGSVVVVLLIGSALFGFLSIGRPIRKIAGVLLDLAGGAKEVAIPFTARGDEVGDAARAAQTFRDNIARLEALEAAQREADARAAAQRKAAMHEIADAFETSVGNIMATVSSAAGELETAAGTLTNTADTTQQLSGVVASASEEASSNVQTVAAATDEMGSSIREIGRQVQESSRIAHEAVKQADNTDGLMNGLTLAAGRIGDVVTLITNIAEQTNLLALNATIEAARAGEAGRGFAVVASEVKALAGQTAKATDEIRAQIAGMQNATQESVSAIKEIGGTIGRIAEISSAIAAAVEEQGAATQEIARNVQEAAQRTAQVADNITDVNRGANETGNASGQVLSSARSLSGESRKLRLEVEKFLGSVRAA